MPSPSHPPVVPIEPSRVQVPQTPPSGTPEEAWLAGLLRKAVRLHLGASEIQRLLDLGANVGVPNEQRESVVTLAVETEQWSVAEQLLGSGTYSERGLSRDDRLPLCVLATRGDAARAASWLERYPELRTVRGIGACLSGAAASGSLPVLDALLSVCARLGPPPAVWEHSPYPLNALLAWASTGRFAAVERLLAFWPQLRNRDSLASALCAAIPSADAAFARRMVDAGADPFAAAIDAELRAHKARGRHRGAWRAYDAALFHDRAELLELFESHAVDAFPEFRSVMAAAAVDHAKEALEALQIQAARAFDHCWSRISGSEHEKRSRVRALLPPDRGVFEEVVEQCLENWPIPRARRPDKWVDRLRACGFELGDEEGVRVAQTVLSQWNGATGKRKRAVLERVLRGLAAAGLRWDAETPEGGSLRAYAGALGGPAGEFAAALAAIELKKTLGTSPGRTRRSRF